MKQVLQSEFINIDNYHTYLLKSCYCCGATESFRVRNGKKSQDWFHNRDQDDNLLCNGCYARLYYVKVCSLTDDQLRRRRENDRRSREKNKDRILKRRTLYREKNRAKINEQRRVYYHKNKEKESLRMKRYRQKNEEKLRQKRFEDRHKLSERRKELRRINKEEFTAKQREYVRGVRIKLVMLLGGKCIRCNHTDVRALHLDHINGGGRRDIQRFNNATVMYNFYLKHPDLARKTLQVLCSNCNWVKLHENGESRARFITS